MARILHKWCLGLCMALLLKGDQSWVFFGRNDAKAETPVLWPPHAKSWLIGKDSNTGRDWGQEEKGMTEDEMAGWHHLLYGCESEWTPGVGDGQGGLEGCCLWGCKESATTERLNWTESAKPATLGKRLAESTWQCPPCHEDWDKGLWEQTSTPFVWGTANYCGNNR